MKELHENSYRVQQDNSSNRAIVAPSNTLIIPPAPSNLLKPYDKKLKAACFWSKEDWEKYVAQGKAANREPPWNGFITDDKGVAMPRQWHRELYEDAKIAFNSLFYRRLDPPTWSKKHGPAAGYFYNTIRAKYPQFLLCDGNWKLQAWATKRYPDWTKNVRGSGGLSRKL